MENCIICGEVHPGKECADNETENSKPASVTGLSCPVMEDCQYVQWLADDKAILSAALREIYNIRGEDEELAKIINEALDKGSAT